MTYQELLDQRDRSLAALDRLLSIPRPACFAPLHLRMQAVLQARWFWFDQVFAYRAHGSATLATRGKEEQADG